MRITFQNPGLIDIRAIQFLGVSVKESENPIGFFGTGLKYAIAVLLRKKQQIEIWRGLDCFKFTTRSESIRGKDFDLIYMNDQPLGITTEYGKNWKFWQVLRELASNCYDEGGEILNSRIEPAADKTTIIVQGAKFAEGYSLLNKIFLGGRPRIARAADAEVIEGESRFIYYRGIRTNSISKQSKVTYNILSKCNLSEDRLLSYPWEIEGAITSFIVNCDNENLVRELTSVNDSYFESDLQFSLPYKPSPTFMKVVGELGPLATYHARRLWRQHNEQDEYDRFMLNPIEEKMLERAQAFCESLGFPCKWEIETVESLGQDILGQASEGRIWLARRAFMQGTKQLATTLLEEIVHHKFGYADETRSMQNWLFEQIVTLGERHIAKEPL